MKEYKLPLATEKDVAWEARHKPFITVKYVFDFPLDQVLRLIDIFQSEISAICCLASAILASNTSGNTTPTTRGPSLI